MLRRTQEEESIKEVQRLDGCVAKVNFSVISKLCLAPALPLRGVGARWGGTHLCLMPLPPVASFPKFIVYCLTSNLSTIWDQIRPLLGQPRNLLPLKAFLL